MAETGNQDGAAREGRGRTSAGPPPTYGQTEPEWTTADFSSLDLGEDSVDTSARPVRRLDLPPLVPTDDDVVGTTPRPTDLGVFASVPDDENLSVSSSAAAGDPPSTRPVPGGDGPAPAGGSLPTASAPKQGTPPHPLAAARGMGPAIGAAPGRDDLDRYRPAGGAVAPPSDDYGDFTTVYEDATGGIGNQFGGPDRRQPPPRGGGHPGGPPDPAGPVAPESRRPQLELAPALPVQKERPRWMIPAGALLGVLALVAGYWFFVRDTDDTGAFAAENDDDLAADLVEEDLEEGTDGADATATTVDPNAPTVLSDSPVLALEGAADGPLEVDTEYEMTIEGVPNGAQYLVVVDDIPQEPALDYLPVLILPEGRHTISVTVTAGAQTAGTNPVEVYVLASELVATTRANLSSVSIADQGWTVALQQFDDFRAAGHENVMLSPSDPYPSLLPGFWNLYVPGFADQAAATAYCEQFELSIPDQCFPAPFDPNGPPRDG